MPELPEVETSRRGIEPHIAGSTVTRVVMRERRLRWPVSRSVDRNLTGSRILSVDRRAKYLLINTETGSAILHLGMSGSVFVVDEGTPAAFHDHFDIEFDSGKVLRFRDPRRFGSLHWSATPLEHPLLAPEVDPQEDVLLALEVEIDRSLAELGLGRDVIDRCGGKSPAEEHPLGRIEDELPPLFLFPFLPFRDAHRDGP